MDNEAWIGFGDQTPTVMSQTIWIARHGNRLDFVNPEWFNTADRPYDPPLSEDGIIQAQQLATRLQKEKITHIFVSPFLRAIQTAHEVANLCHLSLKIEAGLSEWLNPAWMTKQPETLPLNILATQYPEIDLNYVSHLQPQYPETEAEMMSRAGATVKYLVSKFTENILLVGHGASVIGTSWGLVSGQPQINASLCCLVKIVKAQQDWLLKLNGDTSHLKQHSGPIRFN